MTSQKTLLFIISPPQKQNFESVPGEGIAEDFPPLFTMQVVLQWPRMGLEDEFDKLEIQIPSTF